jgi:hypothetical protein
MYSDCCGSVAWNDDISEDGWGRCLECMEPAEFPLEPTKQDMIDSIESYLKSEPSVTRTVKNDLQKLVSDMKKERY